MNLTDLEPAPNINLVSSRERDQPRSTFIPREF